MPAIGFIGLGIMGKPMAQNLLRAGVPLTVHRRSRELVDELSKLGVRTADSPRQLAEQSEIVITMLPDSATVERVIAGAGACSKGRARERWSSIWARPAHVSPGN